ncbi:MAG: hypothetical protein JW818_01600 [Pirellulales bacterium]|nr:hypothetical protein [Pirellulales bacterium]
MRKFRSFCRIAWCMAQVAIFWLAVYGEVLAKDPAKKERETAAHTPWVMPYMLVLLGIGLGMLVICRSSRRSDRAKPEKYESLHTAE